VASVLFQIPLLRELVLWLGCVDAARATAVYNLKKGRSVLIFVGGEKEQLLTENGKHIIYLKKRFGFLRLAIQHGLKVVPMYSFGEESAFKVLSHPWIKAVQNFLQNNLALGIPVAWGQYGLPIPFTTKPVRIEMGTPVQYKPSRQGLDEKQQVAEYLVQFAAEMTRLFDRTKAKHGEPDAVLQIVI